MELAEKKGHHLLAMLLVCEYQSTNVAVTDVPGHTRHTAQAVDVAV